MAKPTWMRWSGKKKTGSRSPLEDRTKEYLESLGVHYMYEPIMVGYVQPEKTRYYKPDFILDNGIVVETKGMFTSADRVKHKHILEQYPELDIRFVFSNPNAKIGKKSKTTNGSWCERLGIKYAKESIPLEWIKEPDNEESLAAIRRIMTKASKAEK